MAFEWDSAKDTSNLVKHGVDFGNVVRIFDGPELEKIDTRREYGEERIAAVGVATGVELFVVYARRGHNPRIISARKGKP